MSIFLQSYLWRNTCMVSSHVFHALLSYNWQVQIAHSRYALWLDTDTHCNDQHNQINWQSTRSHSYSCVCMLMWRDLRVTFLTKSRQNNIVQLAVINPLFLGSLESVHLTTTFINSDPNSLLPQWLSLWKPPSTMLLLDSTCKPGHSIFVFLCLAYFTLHNVSRSIPALKKASTLLLMVKWHSSHCFL